MSKTISQLLEPYLALRQRVDDFGQRISAQYSGQMHCHAGCSACCQDLTLFAVEAVAMRCGLQRLPEAARRDLLHWLDQGQNGCPLLQKQLCLLYPERPLICRTHGLLLLIADEGGTRVDTCPLNFRQEQKLPGEDVLSLERLNHALVEINRLFLQQAGLPDPGRLSFRQALAGPPLFPEDLFRSCPQ